MKTARRVFGFRSVALMSFVFACDGKNLPTWSVLHPGPAASTSTPTYTTIDFPGADRTAAFGINSTGTIVGDFSFTPGGRPN